MGKEGWKCWLGVWKQLVFDWFSAPETTETGERKPPVYTIYVHAGVCVWMRGVLVMN